MRLGSVHVELADLCEQAEEVAEEVRDSLQENAGQIRVSDAIHRALRERRVVGRIDEEAGTDAGSGDLARDYYLFIQSPPFDRLKPTNI